MLQWITRKKINIQKPKQPPSPLNPETPQTPFPSPFPIFPRPKGPTPPHTHTCTHKYIFFLLFFFPFPHLLTSNIVEPDRKAVCASCLPFLFSSFFFCFATQPRTSSDNTQGKDNSIASDCGLRMI